MQNRAFYFRVNTQFDNLGDALINKELIGLLSEAGSVEVDLSAAPAHFRAWLEPLPSGVKTKASEFELLAKARKSRKRGEEFWLVLNPGGNVGEIPAKTFWKRRLKALFLKAFRLCGGKVLQLGVSYEALGPRSQALQRSLARQIDIHLVRDSLTKAYCRKIGVRADGHLDDLAFHLTPFQPQPLGQRIVISFRSRADAQPQDLAPIIANADGRELCFAWQVKRDEAQATLLSQHFAPEAKLQSCVTSIDDNRQFYGASYLTMTNRLHVFLLALSAGGLSVLLLEDGGNHKIRGIVKDVGLEDLIMTPEEIGLLVKDPARIEALRLKAIQIFAERHQALTTEFINIFERH